MGASFSVRNSITALAVVGFLYLASNRTALLGRLKLLIANYVVASTVKKLTAPGGVCELTRKSVDGEEYRVYKYAPHTLVDMVLEGSKHTSLEFLVHTGAKRYPARRLTFKAFASEVAQLGYILQKEFSVYEKEHVVVLMANVPEHVVATVATFALGGVAVLCNAFWESEETKAAILESDARVVILDATRLNRISSVVDELGGRGIRFICVGEADKSAEFIFSYSELISSPVSENPIEDPYEQISKLAVTKIQPEDRALILYTSGTTSGKAKGVVLTHFAVTQAIESYNLFLEVMKALKGKPKIQRCDLVSSPLFHTAGLLSVFLAFRGGHKCVFFPKWEVDTLVETMIDEKVTYFPSVPTMVVDMLNSNKFVENIPNFVFDNIGTGGAKIQSRLVNRLSKLFPAASQGTGWGMTETCAMGTVIGGPQFLATPSSCGKPHAIVDVKLIDPSSLKDITACNTRGELCIRSPTMMSGYWKMPEETQRSFLQGTKWYRTGDVGMIDESGLYYIVDRLKDIVIRGGENISCSEVEMVIGELDEIAEVAVIGMPDERLGEQLVACVVPKENDAISPETVQNHVGKRLAKFKIPSKVIVRSQPLPRNVLGKLVKVQLKQTLLRS